MTRRMPNGWIVAHISPAAQLYAGIALLVAFLLQDEVYFRAIQAALFLGLALLAGKRIRFGYFAIVILSITVFHLVVPSGRVLVEIGSFAVTAGAMRAGLFKGLAIVGMVFLSVASVRRDLLLPGKTGTMVARTFWAFEYLLEGRRDFSWRRPMESADALLIQLFEDLPEANEGEAATQSKTSSSGWVALAILIVANWSAVFVWQ